MSYHKFSNLCEIFQVDLAKNFLRTFGHLISWIGHVIAIDDHWSMVLVLLVLSSEDLLQCIKQLVYVAINTTLGILNKISRSILIMVNRGKDPDSFAHHFDTHFLEDILGGYKINVGDVKPLIKMDIIWYGNVICCMKTFGKLDCCLCL